MLEIPSLVYQVLPVLLDSLELLVNLVKKDAEDLMELLDLEEDAEKRANLVLKDVEVLMVLPDPRVT